MYNCQSEVVPIEIRECEPDVFESYERNELLYEFVNG
jgi:hypothetical protein